MALSPLQKFYRKFFRGKLQEWGTKSPAKLSEKDKAAFFNEIKKEWKKEDGKPAPVKANVNLIADHILDMGNRNTLLILTKMDKPMRSASHEVMNDILKVVRGLNLDIDLDDIDIELYNSIRAVVKRLILTRLEKPKQQDDFTFGVDY